MRIRGAIAAATLVLLLAGCSSHTSADPNVQVCKDWLAAYQARTDALHAYSGSGDDPTVDAAMAAENKVVDAATTRATGQLHDTVAQLSAAWNGGHPADADSLGTITAAMIVACQNLGVS